MKMIICTLIAFLLGGILVSHEAEARFWWNGYNHCHYYHHGRQSDGHRTTEPASREVEVNLTASIREVIDEVKPTHPGVEIVFDADGDLNGVLGFRTIETNDLQLSDQRDPTRRREPYTRYRESDDNSVFLEVHNLGAPIPEEMLPAIFGPSFSRKTTWFKPEKVLASAVHR